MRKPLLKGFDLRKAFLFTGLVSIALTAYAVSQNGSAASENSDKIGPLAVWQPPQDFIAKAHAACDQSNPPNYSKCFIDQMSGAGAPPRAVSFTLMLYRQSDGQVGIMTAFEKVGPVDVARVLYPLRANDNYGLLLVNGDPPILDVDDLKKLDQAAMDQNPMYRAVKQKYTATTLFPGDRSGSVWPQVKPLPDGGQQFILGYPLMNGCHACANVGLALFSWDFNAKGKVCRHQIHCHSPTPEADASEPRTPAAAHRTAPTAAAVSHQRMEGFCGMGLGESCQTKEANCAVGAGFTELPSSGYTPFIRPADNKREPMRKPLLFLVILIFVSYCPGQSKPGANRCCRGVGAPTNLRRYGD